MKLILWILIAYIVGSISWGLLIGKVFFHKDIRNYGSGNTGGTNAGRVFGTPVGFLVVFLDASKSFLLMCLSHLFLPGFEEYIGLAVCAGHCFPLFAHFKGGKAVACAYGYMLGLSLFITHNVFLTFIAPILVFFSVLYLSRMVSLSSMCGVMSAAVLVFLFLDRKSGLLLLALALFVIYRHRSNIERIKNGTESKIGSIKK